MASTSASARAAEPEPKLRSTISEVISDVTSDAISISDAISEARSSLITISEARSSSTASPPTWLGLGLR